MPDNVLQYISLNLGLSWASGINLYAAILIMGVSHNAGFVELPAGIDYLSNPLVLLVAGAMYVVEFIADKIPGVDTVWDAMHTFIRIPAAAFMAYGAAEAMGPAMQAVLALIGGGFGTVSHATKAGSRVLINTSPEPFSNWAASTTEDVGVFGGLWLAVAHPWVFLCFLGLFILFVIWLIPKIWWGLKKVYGGIKKVYRGIKKVFGFPRKIFSKKWISYFILGFLGAFFPPLWILLGVLIVANWWKDKSKKKDGKGEKTESDLG